MKKKRSFLMILIGALLFLGGLTGFIMTLRATLANAGTPDISGKKVIILGDRDGVRGEQIEDVLHNSGAEVIFSSTECFQCSAAAAMDLENQIRIKNFANTYGAENLIVILGAGNLEAARIYAQTVTTGDPTYAGTLSNTQLHLSVFHVFDPQIRSVADPEAWEEQISLTEMIIDSGDINDMVETVKGIREEHSLYPNLPGYVDPDEEDTTATFDTGPATNPKMKNLANNVTDMVPGSYDGNIWAFKKGNSLPSGFTPTTANTVSSSNSEEPIYIWYESSTHTIYYYSEADTIYLNANSTSMFEEMNNLADISGLSAVDTSNVTDMSYMFSVYSVSEYGKISSLTPLANWDTSNVTNMAYMFFSQGSISNISALADWDTGKVIVMLGMFQYNIALTNIDGASNWDTGKVNDMAYMFNGCTKASGTFPILGNPATYDDAFGNAATQSGSQIIVEYDCDVTTNIDAIIATKSSNSNVVKADSCSVPTYEITTSVEHGTITASSEVEEGNSKTISYSPDEGYELESIKVDGTDVSTSTYPSSYTFNNVTADHTIAVVFAKKKASYKVNYLEEGTDRVLHTQKTINNAHYGDEIISADEVINIDNYHFVGADHERITLGNGNNVINLYYEKDSSPEVITEHSITLTSEKVKITSEDDEVDYRIKYNAALDNYEGRAKVEIVDYLPYQIDTDKSDLAGGTYDKDYRTITWKQTVDITATNNQIDFDKSITLVYKNYDVSKKDLTNIVVGDLTLRDLDDYTEEVYDTKTTSVDIKKGVTPDVKPDDNGKDTNNHQSNSTNKIVSDRVNSPNTTTRNMFLYIIVMMISIVCFVLGIKNYKQIKS